MKPKIIVAEIGRLHGKGLTMQIPNGQFFISNPKDVPANATCGLFSYLPEDQFAKFIPLTHDVEQKLTEKTRDEVMLQKNGYIHLFANEIGKKDECRDDLKAFCYAELAAREEVKLVFLNRQKEGEGLGALVSLVSAASLLLNAAEIYGKKFGFPKVAEKCRKAMTALN